MLTSYIILPEESHVAENPDPHKHCPSPKEDAAHIIGCEHLKHTVSIVSIGK